MSAEQSTSRQRLGTSLTVLCAVGVLACAGTGVAWAYTAQDGAVHRAQVRDKALHDGRVAVVNFNSLDHNNVQRGLDQWEKTSAGPLHEEVRKGRKAYAKQIEKRKSTTEAKVLDAGLAELDEQAGKARMISVVQVSARVEDKKPSVQRHRYETQLKRTDGTWKLTGISQVPVGDDGQNGGGSPGSGGDSASAPQQ